MSTLSLRLSPSIDIELYSYQRRGIFAVQGTLYPSLDPYGDLARHNGIYRHTEITDI